MASLVATRLSASISNRGRRPSALALATQPALDQVVAALQRATGLPGLTRTLAIGRILTEGLYAGDPAAFRSRSAKSTSLRRLVKLGSPLSASALYRALSIHEIWTRVGGRRWSTLSAAHYRAVEAVPAVAQQQWLALAAQHGWSGAQLRGAIVTGCAQVVSRGGRLPKHPIERFALRAERELASLARMTRRIEASEQERVRLAELATRLEAIAAQCLDYVRRIRAVARIGSDD